jgi:hypothetical protein
MDLEVIDLQRVDRLQRFLPAAFLDRGRIVDLLARLGKIEVDRRLLDLDIADEALPEEQGLPMDAGAQPLDAENRGLGVGVLRDHDVVEIEREAHGVKVELSDARGIALQRAIHVRLGVSTQGLVDRERNDVGEE